MLKCAVFDREPTYYDYFSSNRCPITFNKKSFGEGEGQWGQFSNWRVVASLHPPLSRWNRPWDVISTENNRSQSICSALANIKSVYSESLSSLPPVCVCVCGIARRLRDKLLPFPVYSRRRAPPLPDGRVTWPSHRRPLPTDRGVSISSGGRQIYA